MQWLPAHTEHRYRWYFLRGNTKLLPEIYRVYHMEPNIISVFKYKSLILLMEGKELCKMKDRKDLDSKVEFYGSEHCPGGTSMRSWTLFYTVLVLRGWRNPWLIPKVALVTDMSTLSLLTHTEASFCFTVPSWSFQQFATSSLLICQSLLNSFYTADCGVITAFLILMHLVVVWIWKAANTEEQLKMLLPSQTVLFLIIL